MEIGACLSAKGCIVSKCNVCCSEYLLSLQDIVSSRCLVICTDTEFCNVCGGRTYAENIFKILYKFMVPFCIYYITPFNCQGNRWRQLSCGGPFQHHYTFGSTLKRGSVYLSCRKVSKAPLPGYYPCVSESVPAAYAKA